MKRFDAKERANSPFKKPTPCVPPFLVEKEEIERRRRRNTLQR